ncbi:hypothetical protein EYF80_035011 [Liparis tanakae]|uniref:Uncharacterized protein n=1 Tax=Liparis tanakae TaxID=230148 RepID=A0A4Z2GNT0_9TELE|nr:hypothetical protein EYF80_035011 [Liparis tanakae]
MVWMDVRSSHSSSQVSVDNSQRTIERPGNDTSTRWRPTRLCEVTVCEQQQGERMDCGGVSDENTSVGLDGTEEEIGLPYLDEVGVEASEQHSLQQLILVAVLVVERRGALALPGLRHHLGFVQVLAELRDEPCGDGTGTGMVFM